MVPLRGNHLGGGATTSRLFAIRLPDNSILSLLIPSGAETLCHGSPFQGETSPETSQPQTNLIIASQLQPALTMRIPTGTVTFLFTDIEGSTKLWEEFPAEMGASLARHDALVREAIERHDGYVFKTVGDAFCAAFHTAPQALLAVVEAQLAIHAETWPSGLSLKVRMALNTGSAEVRDDDYFGPSLNRVARLLAIAHGGQAILSDVTHDLCRDVLPESVTLRALGEHRLKDLGRPESVYQVCHPDLVSEFSKLRSLETLPHNLPRQLTSFIGRESEVEKVKGLVSKGRLLTLTGSGGCGKTRLSLQVAAEVLDTYPDGAWLVELAPLSDPELVARAVAGVLGMKEQEGTSAIQGLKEFLKSRKLLIVLDNCEHLLDACAHLANEILKHCSDITIFASSREGLGIAGEVTYRVPSLSLPTGKLTETPESLGQYEAVRLFVDRALANSPTFQVTNQNAPAVASVCQRLDGIPLAIELAAARLRSMSVEEVNERLDQRFRLLTGGSRTALPRQQTLRSLIDWSYNLLTDVEKSLLCRLSVFAGGWTLEAAEQVCAAESLEEWEIIDHLTSLADKSLVVAEGRNGTTRFHLLETVRQYSRDRMIESGEAESIRDRHLAYFARVAAAMEPRMLSEMPEVFPLIERDLSNYRTALSWSLEGENGIDIGYALASDLGLFWRVRGYWREAMDWFQRFLDTVPLERAPETRCRVLLSAGWMAEMRMDFEAVEAYAQESLEIAQRFGYLLQEGRSLALLSPAARSRGQLGLVRELLEESLSVYRRIGHEHGMVTGLVNLGAFYESTGELEMARATLEEALSRLTEQGRVRGIAYTTGRLGSVARLQGDLDLAEAYLSRSIEAFGSIGGTVEVTEVHASIAHVKLDRGDFEAAGSHLRICCATMQELGVSQALFWCLMALGRAVFHRAPLVAAKIWGTAMLNPGSNLDRGDHAHSPEPDQIVARGREAFGDGFDAAFEEGRTQSTDQAIQSGLEALG